MTTFTGSCLCGANRYEFEGTPDKFFHCHCSRCRKATGTGHASNLFARGGGLTWSSGEEHRRMFKLPEASRFSTHFCTTCGSLLPREIAKVNLVVVPAGSLDCDVDLAPQARIYCGSRAAWSCAGEDGIPSYAEYID